MSKISHVSQTHALIQVSWWKEIKFYGRNYQNYFISEKK